MSKIIYILLSTLFCFSFFHNSSLAQTGTFSYTKVDNVEAGKWREDLRYMAAEMPKIHKNLFHTMTREQFEAAVNNLYERIPSLARHQIIVEMARIVAMVRDGHTNIAPTRDPKIAFRAYPLKFYFFKEGLYVRAAAKEHSDIVGWRVVKIGNSSVEQAYAAAREIVGRDNEMDVKFFAPHLLSMPEVLHALGLIDDMENAKFIVESKGQRKTVNLKPSGQPELLPPDTDTSWMLKADWVDARGDKEPLWLKDPKNKFWYEYLPDSKTVYAQVNQIGNKEDETLEAFSNRLFAFVESNPVDRLILDLRLNRGGDGSLNRSLLRGIIKSKIDQKGKLFAIIGRSTWSAAQFLVNNLESYTNTIFVGEPTGGKINSYGDSRRITLPNSGLTVRVSIYWWQVDERDTRQWTAPQIAADLMIDDYRANTDPALKAILNYTPKKSLREQLIEVINLNKPGLITEKYKEWKAEPANHYIDTEAQVNNLGYALMAQKRLEQAIEVFKLNMIDYPQSANTYDSLGEAYMNNNNKELAIQNYEKALQLNPKLPSAIEALKKLRGN